MGKGDEPFFWNRLEVVGFAVALVVTTALTLVAAGLVWRVGEVLFLKGYHWFGWW